MVLRCPVMTQVSTGIKKQKERKDEKKSNLEHGLEMAHHDGGEGGVVAYTQEHGVV